MNNTKNTTSCKVQVSFYIDGIIMYNLFLVKDTIYRT